MSELCLLLPLKNNGAELRCGCRNGSTREADRATYSIVRARSEGPIAIEEQSVASRGQRINRAVCGEEEKKNIRVSSC